MKRRLFLAAALLAATPGIAFSQTKYPERAIRMLVPFAPGGATDVAARVTASAIAEILGQPVVVENRAGGGGNVGVSAAATSPADGYTLMMGTQALLTQNPYLYADLPKNPQTDLVAVAGVFKTDMILVASPKLGRKTVQDIMSLAATKPDGLNYGSAGNGSAAHILMELLKSRTGTQMRHVPYRGTSLALTDLVAGTLDLMIDSIPSALGADRRRQCDFDRSVRPRAQSAASRCSDHDRGRYQGLQRRGLACIVCPKRNACSHHRNARCRRESRARQAAGRGARREGRTRSRLSIILRAREAHRGGSGRLVAGDQDRRHQAVTRRANLIATENSERRSA
jgi:hypothetical protein